MAVALCMSIGVWSNVRASAASPRPMVPALSLLASIPVALEHKGGYSRDLFPVWIDADHDGCDTRAEVLRRDSSSPVQIDPVGCTVVAGDWTSPYDGVTTSDPGMLDIDHVVSLKEAWDSGAWAWPPARRLAFANDLSDPRTLRAVTATSNRSKGDRDPSNWLPVAHDQCRFVGDWIAIKVRWALSADPSESGRLRNVLRARCPGLLIEPTPPIPPDPSASAAVSTAATAATAPTAQRTTALPAATPAVPAATAASPTAIFFPTCAAARAAGAAPLHVGDPGYRTGLDGDRDGTACETRH